jgi:hypothetical protein
MKLSHKSFNDHPTIVRAGNMMSVQTAWTLDLNSIKRVLFFIITQKYAKSFVLTIFSYKQLSKKQNLTSGKKKEGFQQHFPVIPNIGE